MHTINICILHIKELKSREIKELAWGCTVSQQWRQDLNLVLSATERDRRGGGVLWLIVGVTQIVYQLIPYLLGSIGHIKFL